MLIVSTLDRRQGSWARVCLGGAVEGAVAHGILRAGLGTLVRGRPKGLSIDLGGVTRLDAGGLAVLRETVLAAAEAGCWIEIANARIAVHRQLADDPVVAPVQAAYAWRRDRTGGLPARPCDVLTRV